MDEIEQGFFSDVQAATVRFECSMLQSQFTDSSGQIAWRSLSCDADEDDFAQLWSKPWQLDDVVGGDEVLWLPPTMPDGWTPMGMV